MGRIRKKKVEETHKFFCISSVQTIVSATSNQKE